MEDLTTRRLREAMSQASDFADVTSHYQEKSPTSATNYTLVSATNGPKVVLGIAATGYYFASQSGTSYALGPITRDGHTETVKKFGGANRGQDAAGNYIGALQAYPFRYENEYELKWRHGGTGQSVTIRTWVKGSGPYSAAVVKHGEPVYKISRNLSKEQAENLHTPAGYKVVVDPDIDHMYPMTRAVWDENKQACVDCGFRKPFHETKDRLQSLARHYGRQAVLDRDITGVELPRDNPDGTPKEQAMAFVRDQWLSALPETL